MKQLFLLFTLTLHFTTGHSQKKDTIRIHLYETGLNRFQFITKNNAEFVLIDRYSDTITGKVINENRRYSLVFDSSYIDKRQNFDGLKNSIQLIWHKDAKAPLLQLSFDKRNWFHLDTSKLSTVPTGTYLTSTGFVGCTVSIKKNGIITMEPFNDVGAAESKDTARWLKKSQTIILRGNSVLDKWFTDEKQFYRLPYSLVGRKAQKTKTSYIETYTYFVKTAPID